MLLRTSKGISHVISTKCKQAWEELKMTTLVRPKMKTLHTVKQRDGLLNLMPDRRQTLKAIIINS